MASNVVAADVEAARATIDPSVEESDPVRISYTGIGGDSISWKGMVLRTEYNAEHGVTVSATVLCRPSGIIRRIAADGSVEAIRREEFSFVGENEGIASMASGGRVELDD